MDFIEEEQRSSQKLKHPYTIIFHLLFRLAALVLYVFGGWVGVSFIYAFIGVIILLSMDFWTVKNVSGRQLAGLRWWNFVDNEGNSQWLYESRPDDDQYKIVAFEKRVFWAGLVGSQLFWILLAFIALITFKFKWMLVGLVAILMNGANLYGYLKCLQKNSDMTGSIRSMFTTELLKSMFRSSAGAASMSSSTAGPPR